MYTKKIISLNLINCIVSKQICYLDEFDDSNKLIFESIIQLFEFEIVSSSEINLKDIIIWHK